MDAGLIYKLTWIMNDEKSEYKKQILQQAIDALQKEEVDDESRKQRTDG